MAHYLNVYNDDPVVHENEIRHAAPDYSFPPSFAEARGALPAPWLGGARGAAAVGAYWKAQELLFRNLKRATAASGFKKPYADAAFNENLFMWDAGFMSMHWRYASAAFDFQSGLDNLYAKQHADGLICREIRESDGTDFWHRHDPASTGPNVLAWAELESFGTSGDAARLRRVFPALLAYHRWLRAHRTWPDGSYFACGLASGMDNQPRVRAGESPFVSHAHTAWVDATCQALLSARALARIADEIGAGARAEVAELRAEARALAAYVRDRLWDAERACYADRRLGARGAGEPELSRTRTVGGFWALLAGGGACPPARLPALLAPLDDVAHFNRPTRVPSLAASDPLYAPAGGYWLGACWPPTTYMVLRGLTAAGAHDVAADIGANANARAADAFAATGTVWENMAPEGAPRGGDPSKGDFVGWGGIPAVPVLFEYVFGLRPDAARALLRWDVRALEGFGVARYPFRGGLLHVECAPRAAHAEPPRLFVRSTVPLTLVVTWGGAAEPAGGVPVDRAARAAAPRFARALELPRSMTEAEAARELGDARLAGAGVAPIDLAAARDAAPEEAAAAAAAAAHLSGDDDAAPRAGAGGGGGGAGGGGSGGGGGAGGGGGGSDHAVAVMVAMGFAEGAARGALAAARGDVDEAVARLLG